MTGPQVLGLVLLLTGAAPAHAESPQPPPAAEPRVSLSLEAVPLRKALEQVYTGSGRKLVIADNVPDAPVTGRLSGLSRTAAARCVLRWTGLAGLALEESAKAVTVTHAEVSSCGQGSVTVGVDVGRSAVTGFTPGPGGTRWPNYTADRLRTVRRVPVGQTTFLGGTSSGFDSRSTVRSPLLPFGSTLRRRGGFSSNTFITIKILPDPSEYSR